MKILGHYPLLFSSDHDYSGYMNDVDDLVICCDELRMFYVKNASCQETSMNNNPARPLNEDDLNFSRSINKVFRFEIL